MQEYLKRMIRALHETENLLCDITGLQPLRITKTFWWDSNQAWGEVDCPSDWYRLVWYCNWDYAGETFQETQDSIVLDMHEFTEILKRTQARTGRPFPIKIVPLNVVSGYINWLYPAKHRLSSPSSRVV